MTNYLCSVTGRFPENYLIGVQARGVEEKYERRIRNVQPGDRLVFIVGGVFRTLHEIQSTKFDEYSPLWPEKDGSIFPHRIKISEPLADSNRFSKDIANKRTLMEPVPVTGLAANFSPIPRIAPPPLGREMDGTGDSDLFLADAA